MKSFIILICSLSYTLAVNVDTKLRLNNGIDCPIVGLGTSTAKGRVVKQMVYDAIEVGYRHIDTAANYGNERPIGQAVTELIKQGNVTREDLFITTKIFYKKYPTFKRSQQTVTSVQLALQKLNLNYIDLVLIHFPSNDSEINREIWSGLEDAVDNGLVKSIGVSSFNAEQLTDLLKTAKIIPAMNQIECNPKKNQRELINFCLRNNIKVTAFSPLGKGSLISDPTIIEIGKKHNKTSAQVMIRWQIQRGVVAIPKSSKKERLEENLNVFDFSLTEDEMNVLENLEKTLSIA